MTSHDDLSSGRLTPREEIFVSTIDHINLEHPPGGTPVASPPLTPTATFDRRASTHFDGHHVINHTLRDSHGSIVTINHVDVSSKEGYEKQQIQPDLPTPSTQDPQNQNRTFLILRITQCILSVIVFFCFVNSLGFGMKDNETVAEKLAIYVIVISAFYSGAHIPCLIIPRIRERAEYVFAVLLLDSTLAFMWIIALVLFKAKGSKTAGSLFGSVNVILLVTTLIMEVRLLLSGPKPQRRNDKEVNVNSLQGGRVAPSSPSVRDVVNSNAMKGLRSNVTGGKAEFSTAGYQ